MTGARQKPLPVSPTGAGWLNPLCDAAYRGDCLLDADGRRPAGLAFADVNRQTVIARAAAFQKRKAVGQFLRL